MHIIISNDNDVIVFPPQNTHFFVLQFIGKKKKTRRDKEHPIQMHKVNRLNLNTMGNFCTAFELFQNAYAISGKTNRIRDNNVRINRRMDQFFFFFSMNII